MPSRHPRTRSRHLARGITLIELMIVVAIIGILAAIAYPSYQEYVIRARRADAQGALEGLAAAMERHYTQNGTYSGASADDGNLPQPPTIYASQSPVDGGAAVYNLLITAANDTTYTAEARPVAGGINDGDGNLRINSLGQRSWDRNNDGDYADANETTWERI